VIPRIVVDTNVLVSSFLDPHGSPGAVIDLWKTGNMSLCVSEEILEEYTEVLARLGLDGRPELKELLELFKRRENLVFVRPDRHYQLVEKDPEDDKFIDCGMSCPADTIVSGDAHLLKLKRFENVEIVSPKRFLEQRQGKASRPAQDAAQPRRPEI